MAASSDSERQELSSNARDVVKKPRITELYYTDVASTGHAHSSAHAKENLRKAASSSRHPEVTRISMGSGLGVDSPSTAPHHPPKRPLPWKVGQLRDSQGEGKHQSKSFVVEPRSVEPEVHPAQASARNPPSGYSSLFTGTRPSTVTQKSTSLPSPEVRIRREAAKRAPSPSSKHTQPSRSLNGVESQPKGEIKKVTLANGNERVAVGGVGPIAAVGWEHMQHEVESLRKTVLELQKASRKQSKRIEELCTQASSHQQILENKNEEIRALVQKCSKYEKLISTVEGAIQCQICMEPPVRPFTLAPCGHVLCLSCLQEWFKTSPGVVEDEDEVEDTADILFREKTCPCCRTVVRHRPCPAFMVKDVVSTLAQENSGADPISINVLETSDDDPWKGIFPLSDDEGAPDLYSDDDDLEDDEEDEDLVEFSWMRSHTDDAASRFSYGGNYSSDSDDGLYSEDGRVGEEEEDGEHVDEDSVSEDDYDLPITYGYPKWEPPTVHIDPLDYGVDNPEDVLSLLRRGCSWEMVQNFNIRYSHREGIIVALRSIDHLYASDEEDSSSDDEGGRESLHHVYLGWNIALEEEDLDGETYMHRVLVDIKNRPERWRLNPRYDRQGSMDVKRLVPTRSLEDYSTTDTDIWLNMAEHDMDID